MIVSPPYSWTHNEIDNWCVCRVEFDEDRAHLRVEGVAEQVEVAGEAGRVERLTYEGDAAGEVDRLCWKIYRSAICICK